MIDLLNIITKSEYLLREKDVKHFRSKNQGGKIRKAGVLPSQPPISKEEQPFIPSKGWAEMIRKVYEVDPLICPNCHSQMKIIAFITDYPVVDRIIRHLKLSFQAERPPPPQIAQQELLMAAEEREEFF